MSYCSAVHVVVSLGTLFYGCFLLCFPIFCARSIPITMVDVQCYYFYIKYMSYYENILGVVMEIKILVLLNPFN